ncbi:MAG: phosphotransferase family protein [Gemmatimonadaceae bacterium]|nr:phosphotransferase family protein [Gemmatimonadaceae bacterium]
MTTLPRDGAVDVRAGEALDPEALGGFLGNALGLRGEIAVQQFPRGFSNLTYLVRIGADELVLRRPPVGVRPGIAHDMAREYRVLHAVHGAGVPVPTPLALCEDESVVGAPFYVMRRVHGVILRMVTPEIAAALDATTCARLSETFLDTLVAIHRVPLDVPGLRELGRPEGYVGRQVSGWVQRWQKARTDDVPAMDALAEWLTAEQPPTGTPALVHNDFKYDNLMLAPDDLTEIRAVLDWEMATVGDPLLDLGTSLGYWLEADDPPQLKALGLGISALPGNLRRAELWARYGAVTGREIPPMGWYHAFGLFKIAVIAQQIYARWKAGLTTDPRFGALLGAVQLLAAQGRIAAGRPTR